MVDWFAANVGTFIGLVVSALGAAFALRGEIKRNREVLERLEKWLAEHEATLYDHGGRIAYMEGSFETLGFARGAAIRRPPRRNDCG